MLKCVVAKIGDHAAKKEPRQRNNVERQPFYGLYSLTVYTTIICPEIVSQKYLCLGAWLFIFLVSESATIFFLLILPNFLLIHPPFALVVPSELKAKFVIFNPTTHPACENSNFFLFFRLTGYSSADMKIVLNNSCSVPAIVLTINFILGPGSPIYIL